LLERYGIPLDGLKLGKLKNPVRVYEKAQDDYASRDHGPNDAGIAESCVIDVIRARLVVKDGATLLRVCQDLLKGVTLSLSDGRQVVLRLIRGKNKVRELDPTHFRNLLLNLLLELPSATGRGEEVFAEIQLHHEAVLTYNDKSHAHDHYNFFRALFKDAYADLLDPMLERMLIFLDEVAGTPVALSMLVLIFDERRRTGATEMPASRAELYQMAIQIVIKRSLPDPKDQELCLSMMRRVAYANHRAQRRIFDADMVQAALADHPDERKMWRRLMGHADGRKGGKSSAAPPRTIRSPLEYNKGGGISSDPIPLVKILSFDDEQAGRAGNEQEELPDDDEDQLLLPGGEFQMKHLSFQEALFVQHVIELDKFDLWADDATAAGFLQTPWYAASPRLASPHLTSPHLTASPHLS